MQIGYRILKNIGGDSRAVTALEYGMIAALIAVIAISGFTSLGTSLSSVLVTINNVM